MMALRRPSARTTLTILFALIGAAWGGFLGLRHLAARASALDALENLSLDWRYSLAGPLTPPRHACGYALANRGPRHPCDPGLARTSVDHQHCGLHGAGVEPVQGLLAGLSWGGPA
jgi:hypothetical protein